MSSSTIAAPSATSASSAAAGSSSLLTVDGGSSTGNNSTVPSPAPSPAPTPTSATAASSSAPPPSQLNKSGVIRLDVDYKHAHSASVASLFDSASAALGRSDFTIPLRVLKEQLVETVADLRLLIVENQLREIGLPIRLCVWIEEEVAKLAGAAGGVSVTVPTPNAAASSSSTAVPALPPIPLSAPVVRAPSTQAPSVAPLPPSSSHIVLPTAVPIPPLSSPSKVAIFQYTHDFDTSGVIYYLATKGGTQSWSNPMDAGFVNVTASGLHKESAPLSSIVGRETVRCATSVGEGSYIQIELSEFFCRPTNYTLKHYLTHDTECLREWKLEGSTDGSKWTLLKEHHSDTNLNVKGGTCTWNIDPEDPKINDRTPSLPCSNAAASPHLLTPSIALSSTKHWYRYFRLTMLGPNSSSHLFLACSGLELYGYVLSKSQMQTWQANNQNVSAIPTFMTANYPPWPLPYVNMLTPANASHKGSSASIEDANSTLDGLDEDEYKIPMSIAAISNQLANLSFDSKRPPVAAVSPSAAAAASNVGLFTYSSDFDKNGIIYALATRNGASPWINPSDAGLVRISASSLMDDSAPLSAVVGRDTVRCVTKPLPHSWLMLDFDSDKRILLTHYTFRHYSSWDTECLRSWRMEVSQSGDFTRPGDWTMLREHINDENLNGKGGTFTWSINGGDIQNVVKSQTPWRYLRITQTAENSNKHHYLACSGLELYGKILQADGVTPYAFNAPILNGKSAFTPPNAAAASHSVPVAASSSVALSSPLPAVLTPKLLSFRHQSPFDRNGILHWLATAQNTRQWANPYDSGLVNLYASSLAEDSQPISALVGSSVVRCVSLPVPNQWFVMDFGPNKLVQPTSYSLRHYSSWDTEALRNWRFEGTSDPSPHTATWTLLKDHREDAALDGKGSTATWHLSTTKFFRMFRIYQYDKNSNKHHYLACSGWEIYGNLKCEGNAVDFAPWFHPPQLQHPAPQPAAAASAAVPVPQPIPAALLSSSGNAAVPETWEPEAKGQHLIVSPSTPTLVRNGVSLDKWQMARGRVAYTQGIQKVSIKIADDPHTSNTWRFIIGVVPTSLDCKGAKQWVGTSNSWGYISGTGGKCHNTAASAAYGAKYGLNDIITIYMNFDAKILGFFKNDEYQGTAFTDLVAPVYVACSLTANDSALMFVPTPMNVTAQITKGLSAAIPVALAPPASIVASASHPQLAVAATPSVVPNGAASNFLHSWDPANKSSSLVIDANGLLRNSGSNDKWQSCRSLKPFLATSGSRHTFSIELVDCPKTNNSWQIIVGVVPPSFTCSGNKQWVGAGESYGYIAGTGGKCYNQPKSLEYGEKFGRSGDIITVQLDFSASTIEFYKNGVSQGVAFTSALASGTFYAAVSLTATGGSARLNISS